MSCLRACNPVNLFDETVVRNEVSVVPVRGGVVREALESVRNRTRRESRRILRGKIEKVNVVAVSGLILCASDPLRVIVQSANGGVDPTARRVIPPNALLPIAIIYHRVRVASSATIRRVETGRNALTKVVRG